MFVDNLDCYYLLLQDSTCMDRERRIRILLKSRQLLGGTLVITSKANVEDWARVVRSSPSLSLHLYTESLSKRQKLGAQHLVGYDIVVTTINVRIIAKTI